MCLLIWFSYLTVIHWARYSVNLNTGKATHNKMLSLFSEAEGKQVIML